MKRIILCEGKTDAILISYFLRCRFDWAHTKRQIVGLPADSDNQTLNWYEHPEKTRQELAIWGVGGIDQLPAKLRSVIDRTQTERDPIKRFERIVLFFDRDQRSEVECLNLVRTWIIESGLNLDGDLRLGRWVDATTDLRVSPPQSHQVNVLPIILPPNHEGALEDFLMDSLRTHSAEDENLVDESQGFIDRLPDEPYLSKQRFRPKACLGAILSVMSPDWVFVDLDERLTQIQWVELESVMNTYRQLREL